MLPYHVLCLLRLIMNLSIRTLLFCLVCLLTIQVGPAFAEAKAASDATSKKYELTEWVALIPADDLDALMNPPEYLDTIEDGSEADQVGSNLKANPAKVEAGGHGAEQSGSNQQEIKRQIEQDRYTQALNSTKVRPEFDKRKIRIPGFIVPLQFTEENQVVTTFFLVPFFGACIHQPPPPPNQIIYAEYEPGKKIEALYDAYWIEGTLYTKLIENDMATSAYSMVVDSITPYEYQ